MKIIKDYKSPRLKTKYNKYKELSITYFRRYL